MRCFVDRRSSACAWHDERSSGGLAKTGHTRSNNSFPAPAASAFHQFGHLGRPQPPVSTARREKAQYFAAQIREHWEDLRLGHGNQEKGRSIPQLGFGKLVHPWRKPGRTVSSSTHLRTEAVRLAACRQERHLFSRALVKTTPARVHTRTRPGPPPTQLRSVCAMGSSIR